MATNSYIPISYSHPGDILKDKLSEINMRTKEFAVRTGKPEKTIFDIFKHKSSITPEMAVQFERVLKIPAKFWLNLQSNYNEAMARKSDSRKLLKYHEWTRAFPYNDMAKLGWVLPTRNCIERTKNLLNYFSIDSPLAWEKYYIECNLNSSFKISLKHSKDAYAISAWLRHGEIESDKLGTTVYNKQLFEDILKRARNLVEMQPKNFFVELKGGDCHFFKWKLCEFKKNAMLY
jgi:HTH-type transcriptional regulator / antitoxin HigA